MNLRRIFGFVILFGGLAMIFASMYIQKQVNEGKLQIKSGQESVNSTNSLFSSNAVTKEVGKVLTGGSQNEINEGQTQVNYYSDLAKQLKLGGYVTIIIGIGFLLLFGMRKKKK